MSLVNYTINLNSKDRLNAIDPSNSPIFIVRDLININSKMKAYLSVPYVTLPPTFYNVDNNNHYLTVIEDTYPLSSDMTYDITIPNGNYSVSNFITALTGAMTAKSATDGYVNVYTGTYDPATGKLTISIVGSPGNRTFTYTFRSGDNKDLKCFMGFNPHDYDGVTVPFPASLTVPQPNYSYTSPNSVNFTDSVQAIYVRCNISRSTSGYSTENGNSTDIMKIVPITNNGFSQSVLSSFEGMPDQKIKYENFLNNQMSFRLTNQYNQLIDLQNYDWSMVLLCQYENIIK